ncbi:MAG: AAA family ATPase [Candidatus Nitrosocosmicus sp.]
MTSKNMWSEKYRIKNIDEFIGNEQSRTEVLKWLKNWIKGTKPLLIMGPPGTGKTSFILSMANYFNYDVVELNASDFRNKTNLESTVTPLLNNNSIFGKKLMLFLDEVDGISGREDTGGLTFLTSILKNSIIPIIMAANSKNSKIKELIKLSKVVEFLPLSSFSSYLLLQSILFKEGVNLSRDQKVNLVEKSNGDVRTLLNVVQAKIHGEFDSFKNSINELSVDQCVDLFFSANDISEAKKILIRSDIKYISPKFGYSSQEDRLRDVIYAIFSSIVANEKKISISDLAKILDGLSSLDMHVNKIYENQNWHLLRYANDLLITSLFKVTRNLPLRYSQYSIPFPLLGSIFIRGQSTRLLGKTLGKLCHTSSSSIGMFYLLPILLILKVQNTEQIFFNTPDDDKLNEIILKEKQKIQKTM